MSDADDAVAAALDAFQRRVLPDDVLDHRTDPSLAESLLSALVEQLARYADRHGLDVHDTLEELQQLGIDRSGTETDLVHNFRLGAQVQFRRREAAAGTEPQEPPWRGFITALREAPGGDARCTIRVPAIAGAVHAAASELEPADPLLPVATRTVGAVHHARDAEKTLRVLAAWLKRNADTIPVTYAEKLDDLGRLAEALASWSGGTTEGIVRHLLADVSGASQQAAANGPQPAPVARLAATGFPEGPTPIRPPDPSTVTRLPDRSKRRPRRL
ncbi:hypothetical protein [Actinomadura nitritigenes]|uniref:hypothetical protein n=1 Tax=Actinomadura nitritigenes TaxID=134602 RepID=UPI003D8FF880